MFTKIKQFFLGKPAAEAQAPYKVEAAHAHVEVAPVTAPIVSEPAAKPKAAPKPKKPAAAKPAAKKPAAKKSV
jgi:hypothetical protein